MTKNMIETFDLTKIYKLKGKEKEIYALNNVNLSIKENETFGLLGPNGAGKTTLIQILSTLKQPTSGYATINGYHILKNPKKAKESIALMLDSQMVYARMTGYSNLKFFCKIYKVPHDKKRIFDMAKEFGLDKWLNQFAENYSSGMKMKLALIRTFLLDRTILFLDEPSLGIDIETKFLIADKLKNKNSTILLTSHDLSLVEKLCDRIAFINNGNILKIVKKEDLKYIFKKEIKIHLSINENKDQLKSDLSQKNYISEVDLNNKGLYFILKNRDFYPDLISVLSKYKIFKIDEQEDTLEDVFLKIY
ncbi:MAG: ABC transporter ATP-binding protein [Promethearchaeota archaeon]